MTTDITELAQSLKAAANITADAIDRLKAFPGDELIDLSQHEGEQVDIDIATLNQWYELSSPANIRALVEALEKAQRYIEELREWNAGLAQESFERQQRIAEMESRTVKLPDLRQMVSGDRYVWSDGVYNYSQDVKVVLAAAGIKVEAE